LISALTSYNSDALTNDIQNKYLTNTLDRSAWEWSEPQIVSTESNMGSYNHIHAD